MSDATSWDRYWSGSRAGVAFNQEGANHPALLNFWGEALRDVSPASRILDVASGRGALINQSSGSYENFVTLDYSQAALSSQREAYPFALPVAADARRLPFRESTFDTVLSQFGVEYGGPEAIDGLPGVLAPGGRVILVMHCADSVIDQECRANEEALERFLALDFLPRVEAMFRAGYAVLKGQGDQRAAGEAAKQVVPSFKALAGLLEEFGPDIAAGTLLTLYQETARIQQRIQHHVEEEVLGWLETMNDELGYYRLRMQSMINAALDDSTYSDRVSVYKAAGIECLRSGLLKSDTGQPLAWVIEGVRID